MTSSTVESAARAGRGFLVDVSQVHRRERGMTPYEVMLSESQERMLLVVPPDRTDKVRKVFSKWDIPCREIGEVIEEPDAHVVEEAGTVARVPIRQLSDAPRYRLQGVQSAEQKERQRLALADVPLPPEGANGVLLKLLASPNVASREAVYRQYDHQVQTNTVAGPGSDAAVLRLRGTNKAIALSIDGNGRYCYLDPYRGGQIVVAEVCRNLSCTGAEPLALTDCLNFGDPERPDVYYQLEWCIRGMARACRILGVPVISGNVSLYNESRGQAIFPTPVVGGLGLLEDMHRYVKSAFPAEGLAVALLGDNRSRTRASDLAGSEYMAVVHGTTRGRPAIDLALEKRVQQLCRRAIAEGLIVSAHDCSDGGLAVALAESCIQGGVGFHGLDKLPRRWDATLFGERQSRIIVSLKEEAQPDLERLAADYRVPVSILGTTEGDQFRLGHHIDLPLSEIAQAWRHGLEQALG